MMIGENITVDLTFFEKALIVSGLLFFVNVIYVSFGGGFLFNYIAKAVYLLGIVLLSIELTND